MRYLIGVGNYCAFDDSIGLRLIEYICARGLERGRAQISYVRSGQ